MWKFILRSVWPGRHGCVSARARLTNEEIIALVQRMEDRDPTMVAILEMCLSRGAASTESSVCRDIPAEARAWHAGAAWAMAEFAQDLLRLREANKGEREV